MRLTKTRRPFGTELNITPLIDIVFLVVIFSMAVSQFTRIQIEKLDLPEAHKGAAPQPAGRGRIVVNVLAGGQIVVAGRPLTVAELGGVLSRDAEDIGAANVSVLIRGDRLTPWRTVSEILQACAARGLARVKVAVVEPGSPGAKP